MPGPTRLVEYREGGFDPHARHWLVLLYREPSGRRTGPLARATLDVREDPDRPGSLLVTVRGDARVTHDGRELGPPSSVRSAPGRATLEALSVAAQASAKRRRCPSCNRQGALSGPPEGERFTCRYCALVVGELAA